jgi:hypothetical protein
MLRRVGAALLKAAAVPGVQRESLLAMAELFRALPAEVR